MEEQVLKENKGDHSHQQPIGTDERYQTLFEQVNAAALLTTYEGEILEANLRSCDLLGYSWDELHKLSLRDILSEELDWSDFKEENAAMGGLHLETETRRKDGGYLPVDLSTSMFRMKDKVVMFVLIWDITERKEAEKRLKESEKKYRGLFEYTTDGIMVLDARGDIHDVNTTLCQLVDCKKEELIGKNLLGMEILTPTSMPIVMGQFEQLLSEKTAKFYTTEIQRKNGKVLTVEISSFFLVRKDNEIDNFVLSFRDITDRIESEKRLLMEKQLFQTLLNSLPDSVFFKDDHHRFVLVNPSKAKHSNVDHSEMLGKTDFDFYPEEQAKRFQKDDQSVFETGKPIINKIEEVTRKDGSSSWISVTKVPWFNQDGEIIGTMGISRDITKWKEIQQQAIERLELLQTLLDTIPDSIYFKDDKHRFVLVNTAKAAHHNTTPEKMKGTTDFDYLPKKQAQQIVEDDEQVLTTGEPIINKVEKITIDGEEQWVSVTKVPRYDKESKIIGTMGITRNITEWKRIVQKKTES